MTVEQIRNLILEVKKEIGLPYPAEVQAPLEISFDNRLSNFLRNGPRRKVFLFNCQGGDFDYDAEMTVDKETDMYIENKHIFQQTLALAIELLGEPDPEQLPENMDEVSLINREDISKEGLRFNDLEWTPEYEGGALYLGEYLGETRFWKTSDEYIFLESGSYTGDGDFDYYTLMTITPRLRP